MATALGNLAGAYRDLGRPGEALPLEQRALQVTEAALGPDHPDVAVALGNLALTYKELGRPGRRCRCSSGRCRSPRRRWVPTTRTWRSRWATWRSPTAIWGRPAEALPLEQRALQITETALGSRPPRHVAIRLGNLAVTYSALGRPDGGAAAAAAGAADHRGGAGPRPPATWPSRLGNLAATYRELGQADGGAAAAAAGAARSPRRRWAPTTPARGRPRWGTWPSPTASWGEPRRRCRCSSGRCRSPRRRWAPTTRAWPSRWATWPSPTCDLGRAAEALPLQQRALQITETALGPDHPRVATRLGNLAAHLQRSGAGR